jgi:hypothetical protein
LVLAYVALTLARSASLVARKEKEKEEEEEEEEEI